jgi:predicted transport protein
MHIGQRGVGDVEIAIDSIQRFQKSKSLIEKSVEGNKSKV